MARGHFLIILALAASTAAAHDVAYVLTSDGLHVFNLGEVSISCEEIVPWVGAVCLGAGDVEMTQSSYSAWVSIDDKLLSPMTGFYCQDINGDHTCGGPDDGNHQKMFCNYVPLLEVESGDPNANWEDGLPIYIFVSPPTGMLAGGCEVPSVGTVGCIRHQGSSPDPSILNLCNG